MKLEKRKNKTRRRGRERLLHVYSTIDQATYNQGAGGVEGHGEQNGLTLVLSLAETHEGKKTEQETQKMDRKTRQNVYFRLMPPVYQVELSLK